MNNSVSLALLMTLSAVTASSAHAVQSSDYAQKTMNYYVTFESDISAFTCSGILISPEYVLTTASCMENQIINVMDNDFIAEIGDDRHRNHGSSEFIAVDSIIPHPDFSYSSDSADFDFALIRLKKASTMRTAIIADAVLYSDNQETENYVVGYSNEVPSNQFFEHRIMLRSKDSSTATMQAKSYTMQYLRNDTEVTGGSCQAGEPLVTSASNRYDLIGFTALSQDNCSSYGQISAVYVYPVLDWIETTTGWDPTRRNQ